MARVKVGDLGEPQGSEGSRGAGGSHPGRDADMVATVVKHGNTLKQQLIRALPEQRDPSFVGVNVDVCELIRVLTRTRAKPLCGGEVLFGEEMDREVRGPQADTVGVVGLRQPEAIVLGGNT